MSKIKLNKLRPGCQDVWNAFLVAQAQYTGAFEFPIVQPTNYCPNRLIAFSKAVHSSDYDQWVHFYEDDWLFERMWRNPKRYLELLRRFNGVILPDFSIYRDMPLVMQLWNIYRSRSIGIWLQQNGIKVIVNVRFGDRRTFCRCCDGLSKHISIAIGTHGTLKNPEDRAIFCEGLEVIVRLLEPRVIIVYGAAPMAIFRKYQDMGIDIIQFDSSYAVSHKGAV